MLFLGIDLAWADESAEGAANNSGVVALDPSGRIIDAGWTSGIDRTATWVEATAQRAALLFIDAPLIVNNVDGQRLCEKHVGQRYGWPWRVAANSTNRGSKRRGGVRLRERLEALGWRYSDGRDGAPAGGRVLYECYPYTTIVGAKELRYADRRPVYKRKPKKMRVAEFRPLRASECDELIARVAELASADPPMNLLSHPETRRLVDEPSPQGDDAYKLREDLLDAALCAWTAALWKRWGEERCQVLGIPEDASGPKPLATIIAPARHEQRRQAEAPGC